MTRPFIARLAGLGLSFALIVVIAAGCNSSGRAPESEKAVSSLDDAYASLARATAQVNKSNALLEQLQHGGDIAGTFKQFTTSIDELRQAADDAAMRGRSYRENRNAYLAKWQQEVANMQNPEVKEAAEQRQERVRTRFANVQNLADEVRSAYSPYLRDLTEIQRALSMDLTPSGVKAMQGAIDRAKTDGAALSSKLDALGREINALRGKMTPAGM